MKNCAIAGMLVAVAALIAFLYERQFNAAVWAGISLSWAYTCYNQQKTIDSYKELVRYR